MVIHNECQEVCGLNKKSDCQKKLPFHSIILDHSQTTISIVCKKRHKDPISKRAYDTVTECCPIIHAWKPWSDSPKAIKLLMPPIL